MSIKYFIPKLNGMWFDGTWYEEVTEGAAIILYVIRDGQREFCWKVC